MRIYLLLFLLLPFATLAKDAIIPEASSSLQPPSSSLVTKHVMAVTANIHATQAAEAILKKGGNAIDAAIAAQMVLNVVEPQSSGIGGGGFLLYYDAATRKVHAYDGRETAPSSAHPYMFLNDDGQPQPFKKVLKSGLSVGIPGLLAMLDKAHTRHGHLAWDTLFDPAITLAKNGFSASKRLEDVAQGVSHLSSSHTPDLIHVTQNTWLTNKPLATSFKKIAQQGSDIFYRGAIANDIIAAVKHPATGAPLITKDDLAQYHAKAREPLCRPYRAYILCGMPPPASGTLAILQALGILESLEDTATLHPIMEAMRLAFADRNYYVGDPDSVHVPVDAMLASTYLAKRAQLIHKHKALDTIEPGTLLHHYASLPPLHPEPPSTTHLSIIDKEGNAVSMTSSIEHAFGSGIMVDGFLLNNQLTDFSFIPEHEGKMVANRPEVGKRPRSSMTPMIILNKENKPVLLIGSPGGARIISYVYGVLLKVLDEHLPLQQAINSPHIVTTGTTIECEQGREISRTKEQLEAWGYQVTEKPQTSGIHAIFIQNGNLHAGVDPRREGVALGW